MATVQSSSYVEQYEPIVRNLKVIAGYLNLSRRMDVLHHVCDETKYLQEIKDISVLFRQRCMRDTPSMQYLELVDIAMDVLVNPNASKQKVVLTFLKILVDVGQVVPSSKDVKQIPDYVEKCKPIVKQLTFIAGVFDLSSKMDTFKQTGNHHSEMEYVREINDVSKLLRIHCKPANKIIPYLDHIIGGMDNLLRTGEISDDVHMWFEIANILYNTHVEKELDVQQSRYVAQYEPIVKQLTFIAGVFDLSWRMDLLKNASDEIKYVREIKDIAVLLRQHCKPNNKALAHYLDMVAIVADCFQQAYMSPKAVEAWVKSMTDFYHSIGLEEKVDSPKSQILAGDLVIDIEDKSMVSRVKLTLMGQEGKFLIYQYTTSSGVHTLKSDTVLTWRTE